MIRSKANKVFKKLGRYFASKQNFEDFMRNQITLSNDSVVSKQELTKFFKNVFLTLGEKDVSQYDLEGFLSGFRFNKHGFTPFEEIAPFLFE